ncbi:MAG: hypothetical protein MHPSP_001142 [Paramarteilia canceri]
MSSENTGLIYNRNMNKIKLYSEGKVAMVHSHFSADCDYLDRYCKAVGQNFAFRHSHQMTPKNYTHLLAQLGFNRMSSLFLYCNTIVAGFEKEIVDGKSIEVPKLYSVSFGGCFNEENIVASGTSDGFTMSCLSSFIGNKHLANNDRTFVDEKDAVEIATTILQATSCKETSAGDKGHIAIIRPEGNIKQFEIDLKND